LAGFSLSESEASALAALVAGLTSESESELLDDSLAADCFLETFLTGLASEESESLDESFLAATFLEAFLATTLTDS
jgi:hypothetical protein